MNLIAQSSINFFSFPLILPSLSLLPSGVTSQINYLHTVLFSGPAFGGSHDTYLWILFIFLGFCWFTSMASDKWDQSRSPANHGCSMCFRIFCIFSLAIALWRVWLWTVSLCPYVFAAGEPIYLSSCLLAALLLFFCILGTPVILRLGYLVPNFIYFSLIDLISLLKNLYSLIILALSVSYFYFQLWLLSSFVFLNYSIIKNVGSSICLFDF